MSYDVFLIPKVDWGTNTTWCVLINKRNYAALCNLIVVNAHLSFVSVFLGMIKAALLLPGTIFLDLHGLIIVGSVLERKVCFNRIL